MGEYLFFSDIDGTLLRGKAPIPDSVKAAAKRFADAGGMLTLCTGRSHLSTERIAREMDVGLPCILYSGAVLYDFNGQGFVSGTPLPDSILDLLAEILRRYPGFSVQAYSGERVYLLQDSELLRLKGVREEIEPQTTPVTDIKTSLFKIVLTSEDIPRLKECGETLFDRGQYHFAFASRHFAEVVAAGAGKGTAVRELARRLNIPMSNTFAAGDGMTDYPMLQACACSFAMTDAPKALHDICDYVLPSCAEGGMSRGFDIAVDRMTGKI